MKKLNLNIAITKRFYAFPFFACAKKGTKKAQPILMRRQLFADHFPGQNRQLER